MCNISGSRGLSLDELSRIAFLLPFVIWFLVDEYNQLLNVKVCLARWRRQPKEVYGPGLSMNEPQCCTVRKQCVDGCFVVFAEQF